MLSQEDNELFKEVEKCHHEEPDNFKSLYSTTAEGFVMHR